MLARKAASVLPEPVGAAISVSRPEAISGQPSACASVGASNRRWNQARTAGWNGPRLGIGRREGALIVEATVVF